MASDDPTQKITLTWLDDAKKKCKTSFRIATEAGSDPLENEGAGTVILAARACSDAVLLGAHGISAENEILSDPVTNKYNARDKLAVEYVDSINGHHVVRIPDPDPTVFKATSDKVDPDSTLWTDLVTALEGNLKDKLGAAIKVVTGWRARSVGLKTGQRFRGA